MNSPFNANPLYIAEKAQHMAGKTDGTDCKVFQKVALISMCVMAAAGASQVILQLLKELRRKDEHERSGRERSGRGR